MCCISERSELAEICLERDKCLTVSPTPDHSHFLLQYMFNSILCMFFVTLAVYVQMYLPGWLSLMAVLLPRFLSTLGAACCRPHQPTSMPYSMECTHIATVVDFLDYGRKKGIIMMYIHMLILWLVYVGTLWCEVCDRCVGDRGYGDHPWEQASKLLQCH